MYNYKKAHNNPYHFINSITIIKMKNVIELAFYDNKFLLTHLRAFPENNNLTVSGSRPILDNPLEYSLHQ